jgi:hypothetical protein
MTCHFSDCFFSARNQVSANAKVSSRLFTLRGHSAAVSQTLSRETYFSRTGLNSAAAVRSPNTRHITLKDAITDTTTNRYCVVNDL